MLICFKMWLEIKLTNTQKMTSQTTETCLLPKSTLEKKQRDRRQRRVRMCACVCVCMFKVAQRAPR